MSPEGCGRKLLWLLLFVATGVVALLTMARTWWYAADESEHLLSCSPAGSTSSSNQNNFHLKGSDNRYHESAVHLCTEIDLPEAQELNQFFYDDPKAFSEQYLEAPAKFEAVRSCVINFYDKLAGQSYTRTDDQGKLQFDTFMLEQSAYDVGLQSIIACGYCISWHNSGNPVCDSKEEFEATIARRPEFFFVEISNYPHKKPMVDWIIDPHAVGIFVSKWWRSVTSLMRELKPEFNADFILFKSLLVTREKNFTGDIIHGSTWDFVACQDVNKPPELMVRYMWSTLSAFGDLVDRNAPSPNKVLFQVLDAVHGLGHGFFYYQVLAGGAETSPVLSLFRAVDMCNTAPSSLTVLEDYIGSEWHGGENSEMYEPCACGAFHSFYSGLKSDMAELKEWRDEEWTLPNSCKLLLQGKSENRFYYAICWWCGINNVKNSREWAHVPDFGYDPFPWQNKMAPLGPALSDIVLPDSGDY